MNITIEFGKSVAKFFLCAGLLTFVSGAQADSKIHFSLPLGWIDVSTDAPIENLEQVITLSQRFYERNTLNFIHQDKDLIFAAIHPSKHLSFSVLPEPKIPGVSDQDMAKKAMEQFKKNYKPSENQEIEEQEMIELSSNQVGRISMTGKIKKIIPTKSLLYFLSGKHSLVIASCYMDVSPHMNNSPADCDEIVAELLKQFPSLPFVASATEEKGWFSRKGEAIKSKVTSFFSKMYQKVGNKFNHYFNE